MATWPSTVEPSWMHVRQRDPPLFQMPHMWQPNLHMANPDHHSHCDRAHLGWRKWGAEHPDWYARRAEATAPDWYTRRVNTVRGADTKERLWHWEYPQKPTEKKAYGITQEPSRPWQRGYQATPHNIEGQVQMPKWGLYNPPHYKQPSGVEPLPPLHIDQKHL